MSRKHSNNRDLHRVFESNGTFVRLLMEVVSAMPFSSKQRFCVSDGVLEEYAKIQHEAHEHPRDGSHKLHRLLMRMQNA